MDHHRQSQQWQPWAPPSPFSGRAAGSLGMEDGAQAGASARSHADARASMMSTASARQRTEALNSQFNWIDLDLDLSLSPPSPAFHLDSLQQQQQNNNNNNRHSAHAHSTSSSSRTLAFSSTPSGGSAATLHGQTPSFPGFPRPPSRQAASPFDTGMHSKLADHAQPSPSTSYPTSFASAPPRSASLATGPSRSSSSQGSLGNHGQSIRTGDDNSTAVPDDTGFGTSNFPSQQQQPPPVTVQFGSHPDATRQHRDLPTSFSDVPDSPYLARSFHAADASHPSLPSPSFQPEAQFPPSPYSPLSQPQAHFYDTPSSPGLPTSPLLGPFSSSAAAAGLAPVAPPTSPYSYDYYPPPPSPRQGSSAMNPFDTASRPSTSSFSNVPPSDYRGSYFTDAASFSDASSARRLMLHQSDIAGRAPTSPLVGGAAWSDAPAYPQQRHASTLSSQSASSSNTALPGLFEGSYANAHRPRLATLANESSVWGGSDSDEKGLYGDLNKGMGADEVREKAARRGSAVARRSPAKGWSKRRWILTCLAAIVVIIVGAIAAIVAIKKVNSNKDATSGSSNTQASNNPGTTTSSNDAGSASAWGGDGSTITLANGTNFVYNNPFGGYWVADPFNNSAKAQSWSPPLDEEWDFSTMKIYGVNLGGWLTLEPFITPAFYEEFLDAETPAVDEWTLSENLGSKLQSTLTEHYDTFITEADFAQIAGAGLNWVRISLPFWAIETYDGEPFLEGVAWTYFLKAITWARKYGLRINLDFHAVPGSQNGWNHSGRLGTINFLNGVMGIANAQRTINYIRVLTEFISRPDIAPVVPMFGIVNEAWVPSIGMPAIQSFYLEVYQMMRDITGTGTGKGPVISIHDGFQPDLTPWKGFLAGSDRIVLDSHPYLAFTNMNNDSMPVQIGKPCNDWAGEFNQSMSDFGFTYAGEWSLGVNDCGQFLNGVGNGTRYSGTYRDGSPNQTVVYGNCDQFTDISEFSSTFKKQLIDLAYANMDSFQNWFFWTWKVAPSAQLGRIASPAWCYSCGLENGYIPKDPRGSTGACYSLANKYDNSPPPSVPFDGSLSPWMTGGSGAGKIAATQIASYSPWPPAAISNAPSAGSLVVADLYTMTPTASAMVLTASPTPTNVNIQTPVNDSPYFATVSGCDYPVAWLGAGRPQPTEPPC